MEIRLISIKDLPAIRDWLPEKLWNDSLPGHTFGAFYEGNIVAFASLRLMEGEMCFLDSMASDQRVAGAIRHEALDLIVEKIFDTAKELGFKRIFATTEDTTIVVRAFKHGFKLSQHAVITREF